MSRARKTRCGNNQLRGEGAADPIYNHDKFVEMIVYIVSQLENETTTGDTQLNTLLYYSDITAYRRTGNSISGVSYQNQAHGPTAALLGPVREQLAGTRLGVSEHRLPNGVVQTRTKAFDEPDVSVFIESEIAIMDEVIERFRESDAKEMANSACAGVAWLVTEEGEEIPYRSSLLVREASPAALKYGEELAERLGW